MSKPDAFDATIPVLTEVFQDSVKDEAPAPDAGPAPLAVGAGDGGAVLEALAIDQWSEPQWALLERRLSERILTQLQDRVDFVLEQRLRDSMAEALQRAMAGLTDEIRQGLQQTIETIVVRAVGQELAHLQTLKK